MTVPHLYRPLFTVRTCTLIVTTYNQRFRSVRCNRAVICSGHLQCGETYRRATVACKESNQVHSESTECHGTLGRTVGLSSPLGIYCIQTSVLPTQPAFSTQPVTPSSSEAYLIRCGLTLLTPWHRRRVAILDVPISLSSRIFMTHLTPLMRPSSSPSLSSQDHVPNRCTAAQSPPNKSSECVTLGAMFGDIDRIALSCAN